MRSAAPPRPRSPNAPSINARHPPQEATAVYNTLSIIENLVEVRQEVAEQVVEKTKVGSGRGGGEKWVCHTRCVCPRVREREHS